MNSILKTLISNFKSKTKDYNAFIIILNGVISFKMNFAKLSHIHSQEEILIMEKVIHFLLLKRCSFVENIPQIVKSTLNKSK